MDLSPIVHDYALPCSPVHAFSVYADRIAAWWHPDYTRDPRTLVGVTIEPRTGGRVYATHRDTGDDDWGEVQVWEPGRQLVYTTSLAQPPGAPSEIAVSFTATDTGCAVRFAHGGWHAGNAEHRKKFVQWSRILDRYAALAGGAHLADEPVSPRS